MPARELARIANRLREASRQLPLLARGLGIIRTAAGPWTVAWMGLLVVGGLLPVAVVLLVRVLVDEVAALIGSGAGWEEARGVVALVVAMACLLLLTELLRGTTTWIAEVQSELLTDHLADLIHSKSAEVDLAFYEAADYYDRFHRARMQATYRPAALITSVGSLLQSALTLAAMTAVLFSFGWLLPVALLVSTLPALFVVAVHTVRQHAWRREHTADERRWWYAERVMSERESAAELRLFDLGPHFRTMSQELRRRLREGRLRLARDESLASLGAATFGLAITGVAMAWMVYRALQGFLSLGDLALFYQAFNQGQSLMRSLLGSFRQIYSNTLFVGDLFEFLDLEPEIVDPDVPKPLPIRPAPEIRFDGVSFKYPGSERWALEGFDLSIPGGAISAIVGANGAGKSTLLKLICRFYDPPAGRVEIGGVDVREVTLAELRRSITVLFQQPVGYQETVADNIAFGDLALRGDREAIARAAREAEAETLVEGLPGGYDAMLGNWFEGGSELSVGEWQRLGLARSFLRRAPILLLDEPTSAMDSWAEAEWLDRFRQLATGHTTVIITHRFTTAKRADRIFVMDHGRIIEAGSHDELLATEGRYAASWRRQAQTR